MFALLRDSAKLLSTSLLSMFMPYFPFKISLIISCKIETLKSLPSKTTLPKSMFGVFESVGGVMLEPIVYSKL